MIRIEINSGKEGFGRCSLIEHLPLVVDATVQSARSHCDWNLHGGNATATEELGELLKKIMELHM